MNEFCESKINKYEDFGYIFFHGSQELVVF
jgi:hypothetical protein